VRARPRRKAHLQLIDGDDPPCRRALFGCVDKCKTGDVAAVRAIETNLTGFAEGFIRPAPGRISGVFGSQRILNGQPRQPHYGLDFAAPTGTPVLGCAGGRVTLADEFHFFGKLIVLDHGHGVNSLYAHLSEISVREGESIAKSQRIGAIGMTGGIGTRSAVVDGHYTGQLDGPFVYGEGKAEEIVRLAEEHGYDLRTIRHGGEWWTCYVEQGHYGHMSRKPTWLLARGVDLPALDWSKGEQRLHPVALARYGYEKARRIGMTAMIGGKDKTKIRNATPIEFRDVLISIAKSARVAAMA
jgi:hypothetical protein